VGVSSVHTCTSRTDSTKKLPGLGGHPRLARQTRCARLSSAPDGVKPEAPRRALTRSEGSASMPRVW
jgi:hypothetical protein